MRINGKMKWIMNGTGERKKKESREQKTEFSEEKGSVKIIMKEKSIK